MYVDLLSSAMNSWESDLSKNALIDYALVCRDAISHPGIYGRTGGADALAAEIGYDRALLRLCELHAIAVDPGAFLYPAEARARLEGELAAIGIILDGPSPSRRRTS
jgi:hypothetical protein